MPSKKKVISTLLAGKKKGECKQTYRGTEKHLLVVCGGEDGAWLLHVCTISGVGLKARAAYRLNVTAVCWPEC